MKRLSILAILLFSHTTFAGPASDAPAAKSAEARTAMAMVSSDLVQPLAAKERTRSKFSRARLPAQERRVRILDEQPSKDAAGVAFVRFAIDARHGVRRSGDESGWRMASITGCVYLERKQVFVKQGDEFRPAAFLLGKDLDAAAQSTCQPASARLAHAE